MLNVRNPKARTLGSRGFAISTKVIHSPVTDDSYANPFVDITPGSDSGSAFQPVSPPRIQRKVRAEDSIPMVCDATLNRTSFATPQRSATMVGKVKLGSPCDTTQATSLQSHPSPSANEHEKKSGAWGKNTSFKSQIKQIKLSLPKALTSMNRSPRTAIDLADLAVATICIVPRHGAGIAVGRRPFERMRTSLMLHMIKENENASWEKTANDDILGDGIKNGKAQILKLNSRLRNCIASEDCFVEKSQEIVRLSKDTLEELNDSGKTYLTKNELGQRNLICAKFLSSMYREVTSDEKKTRSNDGLSLMVVGSAFYALGKFEQALFTYQRAGKELKKKIEKSPEYTIHCAKLFNNMGCVYFEMNKYEKAMQTFQRALQLFHNGNDESASWIGAILDQSSIMNNMAYMLIKFKQYDDASDLVDASFELQQILPGNIGKTISVSTLSTMAYIYYRTKNYDSSLDTYTACVHLQDKNSMYNESDQVEVLKKMTDICKKTKDHEKRIYLLRTILVYQQCYLLEDDDDIWETNAALAEALQGFADSGGTCI